MGYYNPAGGKGSQKELADMYGVEGTKFSRPGMGEQRTSNEVERDIRSAMMSDYSTREYLKHNEDVRDEANEIKNLRDQNAFINDSMKQAHKDAGNGGKYSSAADRGGVAQNAFEDYMSQYKMKGSGKKKDKEPKEEKAAPEAEVTYSPEMQQAKERAQNYEKQDPAAEGDSHIFDGSGKQIHKQHDFSKKEFQAA
jgi:hypothetical protein